jgi:hypothetical protein
MKLFFSPIDKTLATVTVIEKHYLHRSPPISHAFGAFVEGDRLKGVLTIGKPCTRTVCEGVCGKERSPDVYELNRLWMSDDLPQTCVDSDGETHSTSYESQFIGWCLRSLKKLRPNVILVSYADTKMGHIGTVYQASRWTYTGTSARFTDIVDGKKFERSTKHRYCWFANEVDRRLLVWKELPYPKRAFYRKNTSAEQSVSDITKSGGYQLQESGNSTVTEARAT